MSNPTFCFALNDQPQLMWAGEGVEALLGFSQEEFLTAKVHLRNRIHPEDAGVADSLFSPNLENRSGAFNIRLRHAGGRIRCIKGQYTKKTDRASGEVLLDLILQDARNVKEPGDTSLVASFKTLIEHTSDYIYIKNRNHVILATSRTVANLTESAKSSSELVGKTDYDIHPEEIADIGYRLEKQAMAEGRFVHLILHVEAQDGSKHWIDNRKYPINGPDGEIIGIFGVAPDITQYIEAKLKLLESEESLREAQRIAGLGSHVLDLSSGAWHASDVLREILGVGSDHDLSPAGWQALVHPDDCVAVKACFSDEAISSGLPFDVEHRIIRPSDQAVRWVHGLGRIERDEHGNPVRLRGTVQDITERKQAEAAILERRTILETALASINDAIFISDTEGRLLQFNDAFATFHKFKNKAECGTHIETVRNHLEISVDGGDPVPIEMFPVPSALRGKTGTDVEYTLRRKDTGETWIGSYNFAPIRGKDGAIVGAVAIARDITEKKRAEAAILESRTMLETALASMTDAIFISDTEGRLLQFNDAYAVFHRFKNKAECGTHIETVRKHLDLSFDGGEPVPIDMGPLSRALRGETGTDVEYTLRRKDTGETWIGSFNFAPIRGKDGAIVGSVLIARDITEKKRAEAALRESKDLLQLLIENAPVALAMFDREMRYLAVSRRWLELYSLVGQMVIGHSRYEHPPEVLPRWKEAHHRTLAGQAQRSDEDSFCAADGKVHWIRWEDVPWLTADGSVGGIVIFVEEITERKQAEERLRLAASVFTGAREGITITDPKGTILEVNDAFTRITGYTREEVLGQNPRVLKSGLQTSKFYQKMWRSLIQTGQWSGEIWNRAKSGDLYAEMLTINAIRDANGKVMKYIAHSSDLTELKQRERELEHIARYDPLTGLPNRALFADRLRQAMAQSRKEKHFLAVVYFDLDGFKAINDCYGKSVGDALLIAMAFRMKRAMRECDTVARLGGDEFAAVLCNLADAEGCMPALNRALQAAAEEAQIGDVVLCISASAGVTFYPQTAEVDADVLLRQAEQAMYQAKLSGRGCFSKFDPGQDLVARSRIQNVERIRQALTAREVILYYQPIVNMRTGTVIGTEALIRWQHPERGLLPPGMFLPVIEDHPMAIELGEWAIDTALAQIETWQAAGLNIPVSVNVGALQLQQPDFVDRLKALLAAHPRVNASKLELEVLETNALQDLVQTSQVLQACREMGVPVALDDFGTGYSSLTYLKRLPAGILKIDRSFVSDMLDDPEDIPILEGLLGFAAAFRRQVIAEGVETLDHGLMLLQLGCELAQGYAIAQPMPAADFPDWVSTWRPDPRWADVLPVSAWNRMVMYASVEHRAWLAAFEACLEGRRAAPPPLDPDQCRIGAWIKAERKSAHGKLSAFQAIETLHRQFHALAAEIYASQAESRNGEGLARLRQLHCLHDECLNRLKTFARNGSGKTGNNGSRSRAAAAARAGMA